MDIRQKVEKLMNDFEKKEGKRPTKISFTHKNLVEIWKKGYAQKEILSIIQNGDHKELIGKKWGLTIIEVDADELKVE